MQYILSEEEYAALKAAAHARLELNQKGLQALCTKIADEMPVKYWNNPEAKPWGCKITVEEQSEKEGYFDEWYCDECPVQTICPARKSYSK